MNFGLPVITTIKTPWSIIQKNNLGWIIKPEVEELKKALKILFSSSEEELNKIGKKAKLYISKTYDLIETSRQMKEEILLLIKN